MHFALKRIKFQTMGADKYVCLVFLSYFIIRVTSPLILFVKIKRISRSNERNNYSYIPHLIYFFPLMVLYWSTLKEGIFLLRLCGIFPLYLLQSGSKVKQECS
jgi:hypothetical protein